MVSLLTDTVSIGTSQSFGSFGRNGAKRRQYDTCSQPFGKPNLSHQRADQKVCVLEEIKLLSTKALKILHQKLCMSKRSRRCQVESMDESKALLRDLAAQLNRISQCGQSVQTGSVDECSLAEGKLFILQWAKELNKFSGPVVLCESWEQYEEVEHKHPEEAEKRLKAAQKVLSTWAAELEAKPQGSVRAAGDVRCVLEELQKQWKRGQLPNMLPVLDFIMWSVLQEQPPKGLIPQLWLKTKQRFRSQGAAGLIPDKVWSLFHESHVNVTLDRHTAHPDFVFSTDGKRVRVGHIIESQRYPRWDSSKSPHKFDGWWCVQGTQGFSSGRAYWEVGVTGKKDWRLGVVKETAQRKGFMDLNTQSGYWTLRLQRDKLRALTVPAKDLPLPHPLSRVGIYLDVEEDQLSFYDAERRSHIFTFNQSFPERVFPIFGTIETDTELTVM